MPYDTTNSNCFSLRLPCFFVIFLQHDCRNDFTFYNNANFDDQQNRYRERFA